MNIWHKLYSRKSSRSTILDSYQKTPTKQPNVLDADRSTKKKQDNVKLQQAIPHLMNELETLVELLRSQYDTFIEMETNNIHLRKQNDYIKEEIERLKGQIEHNEENTYNGYMHKMQLAQQQLKAVVRKLRKKEQQFIKYLENVEEFLSQPA